MELLRGCAGLDMVGGDVVEVAPQYDATTNTAQAAAQMMFEILTLVALTRLRARPSQLDGPRPHHLAGVNRRVLIILWPAAGC